jgi:hypothetical protein
MMNRKILLAAAFGLVLAGPAVAQSANSSSVSSSSSAAQSSAQSGSVAGAQIINNNSIPAQTTQTQRCEGGYDLRSVPNIHPPGVFTANPCVVGISGGFGVAGFGMSIGAGVEDRGCTRRQNAALLISMGHGAAAREVLCNNAETRAAFRTVGMPCASDVQQAAASAPAPVLAFAPPARPDWCTGASWNDGPRVREICGLRR